MTKIKMQALDTFHASNVQSDNLLKGDTFEINEGEAKQLEAAKLAKRVGTAKEAPASPQTKMEPAPANKAIISADSVKAPAARKAR